MDKKIVLITGASSGFGFLTTIHLAIRGYFVIATMRDLTKKENLLVEARKRNIVDNIEVLQLDVTNKDDIFKVKNHIESKYGKLDILINNAGYCLGGLIEYANMDEWEQQINTNVLSVVAVTKAFIPMMRKRRCGNVINIGSVSGHFGFPGMGAYVTSKFALSGFSESLRLELAPFDIHVSIIEASSFKTNIWDKSLENVNLDCDVDYKSYIHFVYEQAKHTASTADDPQKIVQLIEKICRSKKPRLRYPIGKSAKKLILAKTILPWSIIERVVLRKLKKCIQKNE
jgi:NAD(P)-dependent dehydrogenase (short-subunit alcohol dehydrogenase family)